MVLVGSGPALAMARREARSTILLAGRCIFCVLIDGIVDDLRDVVCKWGCRVGCGVC